MDSTQTRLNKIFLDRTFPSDRLKAPTNKKKVKKMKDLNAKNAIKIVEYFDEEIKEILKDHPDWQKDESQIEYMKSEAVKRYKQLYDLRLMAERLSNYIEVHSYEIK